MVPVNNDQSATLLRDVYTLLTETLSQIAPGTLEAAWACWIYPDAATTIKPEMPTTFNVNNYQHIAQLGLLVEAGIVSFENLQGQLQEGLKRTAGRPIEHVNGDPAPFRSDPVALLGLAIGANRVGGETLQLVRQWMDSFINPSHQSQGEWKTIMQMAALNIVGSAVDDRLVRQMTTTIDLQLAFMAKGISCFTDIDFNAAYQSIAQSAFENPLNISLAPARLQALDYLLQHLPTVSVTRPTIEQLATMLNRIPAAFKRWPWEDKAKTGSSTIQQWDLQNEYHVQSLVYFLLAPIFPDIESEFYSDPTAQLNPRADIGLPSLHLIIEIKFLRQSKRFSEMIEEVAADASLYFKPSSVYKKKYSKMLVLLWDDSSRTHEHELFKKGVRELEHIEEVVVIARPGILPQTTSKPQIKRSSKSSSKSTKK